MRIFGLITMLMVFMSMSLRAETVNLNDNNSVFLKDVVMDDSITQVISELAKREGNTEPVLYLVLDTPGGSVFAGLNLINYLKGFKKPVKTVTVFAASMGFQIAQGNPHDRLIADTGVLMSHPMSGGMGGEIGNGLSLDSRIGYIKEIVQTMDNQVVARTKGKTTLEKYQKAYDNELWTTGKNAIQKGYADSVVSLGCSPELAAGVDSVNVREWIRESPLAVELEYETSKCPIMTAVLRYQIRLVHLPSGQKLILYNNGYDISENDSDDASEKSSRKMRRASGSPRAVGQVSNVVFTQEDIKKSIDMSVKLKNFQFFLKRDMDSVKSISWL